MFSVQLTSVVAVGAFFFFLFFSVFFTVFQRLWIKFFLWQPEVKELWRCDVCLWWIVTVRVPTTDASVVQQWKAPTIFTKIKHFWFSLESYSLYSLTFKCDLTQWAHLSTLENLKHVWGIKQIMCCQPGLRMPTKCQNYPVKLKITWNKRTNQIITCELWQARVYK